MRCRREPILGRRKPILVRRKPMRCRREPILGRRKPILCRRKPILVRRKPNLYWRKPILVDTYYLITSKLCIFFGADGNFGSAAKGFNAEARRRKGSQRFYDAWGSGADNGRTVVWVTRKFIFKNRNLLGGDALVCAFCCAVS